MPHPAILLPGAVLPADLAYAALAEALGERAEARIKDLELYAGDEPPPGYGLDLEIEAVERDRIRARHAESTGEERHLVGLRRDPVCGGLAQDDVQEHQPAGDHGRPRLIRSRA